MRWMWDSHDLWIDPARFVASSRVNRITGTQGDDRLTGTNERDIFDLREGGDDVVRGKGGNDSFNFGDAFSRHDKIFGGEGHDKVVIAGNYSGMIEVSSDRLHDIESVSLQSRDGLSIVVKGNFSQLYVDASLAGDTRIDASGQIDGSLRLDGGLGEDTLIGGSGDDRIAGSGGADVLSGGAGHDHFSYFSKAESEDHFSHQVDTITDFTPMDSIFLPTGTSGLNSYHVGTTEGRIGDVTAAYDAEEDRTVLNVFLDSDKIADMTIYLSGDKSQIGIEQNTHVVLVG